MVFVVLGELHRCGEHQLLVRRKFQLTVSRPKSLSHVSAVDRQTGALVRQQDVAFAPALTMREFNPPFDRFGAEPVRQGGPGERTILTRLGMLLRRTDRLHVGQQLPRPGLLGFAHLIARQSPSVL